MGQTTKPGLARGDEVARLTAEVEALRARLEKLEAGGRPVDGNGKVNHSAPQSRRDILKLAGAAAAGAAGSIVLGAVPAAAANTQPVILGNQTTNDAATTTDIFPTTGATPAPLFQATGQGVTTTTTVPPTVSTNISAPTSQSIPLIGAIGPGGSLPLIGTQQIPDYPGFAPIQGVGGKATITTTQGPRAVSEGLNGIGFGDTGIGVTGESDTGWGVAGSSGGIDLVAIGHGRISQVSLSNNFLTAPPIGPPNYIPNDFEQVRDGNGVLYISVNGTGFPPTTNWLPVQVAGLNQALFTASTTKLLGLKNSDGITFVDMMPDNSPGIGLTGGPDLVLNIKPMFDCYAMIRGSASLYTDTGGMSQDIGIYVSGSSPPQSIVAWAESGGTVANTPNAVYVDAIVPMTRGTTYNVRLMWKANHAAGSAIIRSGAGPFPLSAGLTSVSPTRLTALLVVNP
jgi:hypothetical protein